MRRLFFIILMVGATSLTAQKAWGASEIISKGKSVKLNYTLTVQGNLIEKAEGENALVYVHGQEELISGLEEQLEGMKVGEKKTIAVSPEKGYGPVDQNLFTEFEKERFAPNIPLTAGQIVEVPTKDGKTLAAAIVNVNEKSVTLNFNHPLAGFTLTFDVEILEINPTPTPGA